MRDRYLKQEGYGLIGAAFEVYNEIGFGLAEDIYHESLEIELGLRGIEYKSKQHIPVFYKNQRLAVRYIPDLVLFDQIVVELKSVKQLAAEHEAQIINYMRISKSAVGYLINFGCQEKLEWKRFVI